MCSILLKSKRPLSAPLLYPSSSETSSATSNDDTPISPTTTISVNSVNKTPLAGAKSYKLLDTLSDHVGPISCLALCGEFVLSASQGKDIIVRQQPDLKLFTRFGAGEGAVKSVVTVGDKVFTAHQDSRIRVWRLTSSPSDENVFRLVNTLPTARECLGRCLKQSNYVQVRRHHKKLWVEHADTISCLAVEIDKGLVYSGSWDKTLKVWRVSDLRCLDSIQAHDDAINGVIARNGVVYSASSDGKVKVWEVVEGGKRSGSGLLKLEGVLVGHKDVSVNVLVGHKDVSVNAVIVSGDGRVYGGASDGWLMGWEREREREREREWGWKMVVEVKAHDLAVLCLNLMGDIVCSGSADKSISLWKREDLGSGLKGELCKVGVIRGHDGPIRCLESSSNCVGGGFLLYSGSHDKSLRVWWVSKDINDFKEF